MARFLDELVCNRTIFSPQGLAGTKSETPQVRDYWRNCLIYIYFCMEQKGVILIVWKRGLAGSIWWKDRRPSRATSQVGQKDWLKIPTVDSQTAQCTCGETERETSRLQVDPPLEKSFANPWYESTCVLVWFALLSSRTSGNAVQNALLSWNYNCCTWSQISRSEKKGPDTNIFFPKSGVIFFI